MQQDTVIQRALESLGQFHPKSVFLYGSRGRGDAIQGSDYELGVVFDDDTYVQRNDIHAAISNPSVKAYPFKWSELSSGQLDFLFQKSIYLREIIKGGKTIAGDDLLPMIKEVPITTLDLLQRLRFDIGMALAALLSYRTNDMQTSMEEFSKSCLFGLRCLEILELKLFPNGYDNIYVLATKVVDDTEYLEVIKVANDVRQHGQVPAIDMLYNNISLLDTYIEPKILAAFDKLGNVKVI